MLVVIVGLVTITKRHYVQLSKNRQAYLQKPMSLAVEIRQELYFLTYPTIQHTFSFRKTVLTFPLLHFFPVFTKLTLHTITCQTLLSGTTLFPLYTSILQVITKSHFSQHSIPLYYLCDLWESNLLYQHNFPRSI